MRTGDGVRTTLGGLDCGSGDYEAGDGGMIVAHNVVNSGAGLECVREQEVSLLLDGTDVVAYVHNTTGGSVYLVLSGTSLWLYVGGVKTRRMSPVGADFSGCQYSCIGNVLVIAFPYGSTLDGEDIGGLHYYRWKEGESAYTYLGQSPPDIGLEFSLRSVGARYEVLKDELEVSEDDVDDLTDDEEDEEDALGFTTDDKRYHRMDEMLGVSTITDAVMGLINDLSDEAAGSTEFLQPFFVRYAYKLYDGSYIMQSAPILMVPDKSGNPLVAVKHLIRGGTDGSSPVYLRSYCSAVCNPMALHVRRSLSSLSSLMEWEDVIDSVCVFITPQVINYSSTGETLTGERVKDINQRYYYESGGTSLSVTATHSDTMARLGGNVNLADSPIEVDCMPLGGTYDGERYGGLYDFAYDDGKSAYYYVLKMLVEGDGLSTVSINALSKVGYVTYWTNGFSRDGEIKDWLEGTYTFYKIAEYKLRDLSTDTTSARSGKRIQLSDGYGIKNLTTFEQLDDGYMTWSKKVPSLLHAYNRRLNIANALLSENASFPFSQIGCRTWYGSYTFSDGTSASSVRVYNASVRVYLEDDGTYQIAEATLDVSGGTSTWGPIDALPGYFFYPNPAAKYARISFRMLSGTSAERVTIWLRLRAHSYLYGSWWFSDDGYYGLLDGDVGDPYGVDDGAELVTGLFDRRNYIYTSEVDNPFVWPSEGVNAVGNGTILAIRDASKALSEGTSFGTAPLYAFATDGIYPLQVGDTGLYVALNAPTRETLLDGDSSSVCQLDGSIAFISERGVMEISGSTTRLLSGALSTRRDVVSCLDLPRWEDIQAQAGSPSYSEAVSFPSFLHGARMAFDYAHYQLWVYHPYDADDASTHTAYVLDLGSGLWSTCDCRFLSSLDGYPGTLVNMYDADGYGNNALVSFSGASSAREATALWLTRPLKLVAPDTLKSVRTLLVRGVATGERMTALWGSRDMINWVYIGGVSGNRIYRLGGSGYKYLIVGGWLLPCSGRDTVSGISLELVSRGTDRER